MEINNNLPRLLDDSNPNIFRQSIHVLVRVNIFGYRNACYIYASDAWIVDGIHGDVEVLEWWEYPEKGTGIMRHAALIEKYTPEEIPEVIPGTMEALDKLTIRGES